MSLTRIVLTSVAGVALVAAMETAGGAEAPAAATAPAAGSPKVLRHLEFSESLGESSKMETKVSGFEGRVSGTGHGTGGDVSESGKILIDVVAATPDGGIVADVTEHAEQRTGATARVGVIDDRLLSDGHSELSEEERIVLRYLARGFVKPNELAAGTSWIDNGTASDGSVNNITYKVTSLDSAANTVALDFEGSTEKKGANGFQSTTNGTMTYDLTHSVPLALTVTQRIYVQDVGRLTTIDRKLTGTLVIDSFKNTPGTPAIAPHPAASS